MSSATGPGPSIAFIESAAQADVVLRLTERPGILIPLTPTAAWRLEQAGASYRKAESFYDERTLSGRMDEIMDAQAAWARWLDGWLQERVPEFQAAEFQPAQTDFFFLKVMFDALRLRALILESVWREARPSKVIGFGTETPKSAAQPFRGSLAGRCLIPWARVHGAELEIHALRGDERFAAPPRRLLARLTGLPAKLSKHLQTLLPAPEGRILTDARYDVAPVDAALRKLGLGTRSWDRFMRSLPSTGSLRLPGPLPWELPGCREAWDPVLRPEGLDLTEVARSRLEDWWGRMVPEAWEVYRSARRAFRDRDIRAVVVPVVSSYRVEAALAAAKAEKIPVHIYQHGGFGGNCAYPIEEYQDLRLADCRWVYGEGAARHYSGRLRRYPDRRARIVAVGSARLDALSGRPDVTSLRRRLEAGSAPGTPLILYFPGMHAGYDRYLSGGEMPDVSHWEFQRDVVRVFRRFPHVRLIYRPFEGAFESPIPALIAEELPSARIAREATLLELAWAADAVLCDIPSTGLLEVLLTDRPILAYSDARSIGLLPEAKKLLERRASVEESPEGFAARLSSFLTAAEFRPLPAPNRDFLKAYGTHKDDGRSAERAVRLVVEGPYA